VLDGFQDPIVGTCNAHLGEVTGGLDRLTVTIHEKAKEAKKETHVWEEEKKTPFDNGFSRKGEGADLNSNS